MARNSKQSPKKSKGINQPALQKALREFLAALGYDLDDIIPPASKASGGAKTSSSESSTASSRRGSSTPESSTSGNSSKSGSPPKSTVKSSRSGSTSKSGSPPKSPVNRRGGVKEGRIVKKWPFTAPRPKSKGLPNLGRSNFCYRNSLFQALLHIPAVARYLRYIHDFAYFGKDGESPCGGDPETCVSCAIQNLWISYWWEHGFSGHRTEAQCLRERVEHVNSALLHSVPKGHDLEDEFKLERMSDPHDLLAWILAQLEQHEHEVQPENVGAPTGTEIFGLWMDSRWECKDCGEENLTECVEPQKGLEITLQNPSSLRRGTRPPSLVQYLRGEFAEELEIRCEGECHTRKADKPKLRERRKVITRAPEVLKIMFKRFAVDMTGDTDASTAGRAKQMSFTKNRIDVKYEEYLNLGEFTDSDEPLIYRLDSVVAHSGSGIDGGHYIAGVREYHGKTFCCIDDDLSISQQKGGTIEELQTPSIQYRSPSKFDPYILFYTKIT
ncbi:hypothetical protein KC340_g7543 [Hortaea werneckii]|nr:hypothetical protein KC342_g10253 [Hortaea werneckii]KAI7103455.1 hypothetical protein KC339_g5257 [Hortaea werneckii]KAI7221627.1 hypothetical protein KC365_g11639 [Hortaea werneckii]KAI7320709.1 hypothetical protein KC340_g7543 [Hortaea werneckii]KAI7387807.1 hypothetical protein KC328_g9277 [Hortaea werneckii]